MSGPLLTPGQPKFAINSIVYARESAKKGFVEPLAIREIGYDNLYKQFKYTVSINLNRNSVQRRLFPVILMENEIATLCEALDLQKTVLDRELALARKRLEICNTDTAANVDPIPENLPTVDGINVLPPAPLYNVGAIVYLIESAEVTGNLEAYRIDGVRWENEIGEWVYKINISPRPEHNSTMGARITQRKHLVLEYPEGQLCPYCNAISAVVKFLESAVFKNRIRRQNHCGE
jgi:hypothetical protein